MSCGVFTTHLELDGDTLIGALFLTYRLDLSAFEEWILPKLLPLRHPPGEALFAEEARRRLLEVPIAVVADASCLEQVGESGDGTSGTCGVPVVRFSQPSGAFHPKLALLACKARGVRVVIGSANLTEAGITKQIELVSSFWLNDHPSTVPGLRAVLRALEKRLVKSPGYVRAAKLVERSFPKGTGDDTGQFILCSTTSILDQALAAIAKGTNGNGRVEEVSIVSPFFERGSEDRSLLDHVSQRIKKHLPRTRNPHYVLRLSTKSVCAPYHVEAPVDRLRAFAVAKKSSFECRALTPDRRSWGDDPSENSDDRKPRTLHGKLITVRVKHGAATWVYTLLGSPNFTKAALLGANFEIALLQRALKMPAGLELPADKITVDDLVEDVRKFDKPPRETACIDRILMSLRDRTLEAVAVDGMAIPDSIMLRARGQGLPWQRSGPNVIVRPFDDGTCAVVDVKLTDHWYPFPIEIIDPEVLPATEGAALSLEQLLERSAAYAADPDGVGMGGGRRSRGPKSKDDNAQNLTSMADVAPQLESICELAIALETSLVGAPTPEAMHARFRAYFEPTLRALSQCDPPEQLRSRMFALLDVQRAADRVRRSVPARDRARRSILDEICMECASFPTRLEKSLGPGDRAWIVGLRRRFEAA